jgi:hypothetical protein
LLNARAVTRDAPSTSSTTTPATGWSAPSTTTPRTVCAPAVNSGVARRIIRAYREIDIRRLRGWSTHERLVDYRMLSDAE